MTSSDHLMNSAQSMRRAADEKRTVITGLQHKKNECEGMMKKIDAGLVMAHNEINKHESDASNLENQAKVAKEQEKLVETNNLKI